MAEHSDGQLARALVHDAFVLCDGGTGQPEVKRIAENLALAGTLMDGRASDEDRARVYEIVHPSTRSNYLS